MPGRSGHLSTKSFSDAMFLLELLKEAKWYYDRGAGSRLLESMRERKYQAPDEEKNSIDDSEESEKEVKEEIKSSIPSAQIIAEEYAEEIAVSEVNLP